MDAFAKIIATIKASTPITLILPASFRSELLKTSEVFETSEV